jgi:hypothetical protein
MEYVEGEPITTFCDRRRRRPNRATGPGLANLQRIICLEAPDRPSVATLRPRDASPGGAPPEAIAQARSSTPARLRRALAGDIDTIVVRALQHQCGRRARTNPAKARNEVRGTATKSHAERCACRRPKMLAATSRSGSRFPHGIQELEISFT